MKITDIYVRLQSDIRAIERELERSISSDGELLGETSNHLLQAGGKRMRPALVLLAGQFGEYNLDMLKKAAVPIELIHMATLVHDDVIDDAEVRRGRPTVGAKWDNRIAMVTGDYIFSKAIAIATELPNVTIHRIISNTLVEMCIGEMEQIRHFFNAEQTVRDYLLRIKRKTALLIAISCQVGSLAAGVEASIARRLYRYGYYTGMAFQITDDMLDICGTQSEIGKPPGSDMRQGNLTLPVLHALRHSQQADSLLEQMNLIREQEADASRFVELVRASGAIEHCTRVADAYIEKAIAELDGLPNKQAKRDLTRIARFVGNRSY